MPHPAASDGSGDRDVRTRQELPTGGVEGRRKKVVLAGLPWDDLEEHHPPPDASGLSRTTKWALGVVISAMVSTLLALLLTALLS